MQTCLWCKSESDEQATAILQRYCSGRLSAQETESANVDFIYCGDCVEKYHTARDGVPALHKRLWDLETRRLLDVFHELAEEKLGDADIYVLDDGKEQPVLEFSPEDAVIRLRIPLMEVLKYPYLLCHRELCDMVIKVICKMQDMEIPLPVNDKHQGIYLLMVHPNEMVRRWAIATARSLGRVKRDHYYCLEEIFSCMFLAIELGISLDFPDPDNYSCGKMERLPSHLYNCKNEKNYWLGVCMLLMQLDSQAMDSLFMRPERHTTILQCIMNTMTDSRGGDKSSDPFWPALQCFMVILDRLGSTIWSQIEPVEAFYAVTRAASYAEEIQSIRQQTTGTRVKLENESDDDDMMSCSQIVYDCYSAERGNRGSGWSSDGESSSAIIFEEMSCLVNILQSDMGQDMRVYGSTFLWFVPFVHSVMELAEPEIIFILIQYLYNEVNKDVRSARTYDKVTEFFVRILVDIIKLHLRKDCMGLLECCTKEWVEVLIQSAILSDETCVNRIPDRKGGSRRVNLTSSYALAAGVGAVSQACMELILALLKKGRRMSTDPDFARFLDLLNIHLREAPCRGWNLSRSECDRLHNCLVKLVKAIGDQSAVSPALPPPASVTSHFNSTFCHTPYQPQFKDAETGTRDAFSVIKDEPLWESAEHKDFCGDLEENVETKKEPHSPILISPLKVELKPDFGKIQEIRDRLNDSQNLSKIQAIAARKTDSGQRLNVCSDLNDAGCISGNNQDATPGSHKLNQLSKNNWNEDFDDFEPLAVQRKCQKRSHRKLCSDSEDASDCLNMSVQPSSSAKKDTHSSVIIISDEELDFGDTKCMEGAGPGNGQMKAKHKSSLNPVLNEGARRDYDDLSESQVFEFETQENIASVWHNVSLNSQVVTKERRPDTRTEASAADVESVSGCVSQTQPIAGEDIENAFHEMEEQIYKQQKLQEPLPSSTLVPAKPCDSPEKLDNPIQPKPIISKSPTKTSTMFDKKGKRCQNKKTLLIEPLSLKLNRRSHAASAHDLEKLPSSTTPSSESPFAASPSTSTSSRWPLFTPAIVPPKKVRKHGEPVSVVERLGLKKRERKAFDFSQRTLDSLGELRSHGQTVHVEPQQKTKRIRRDGKPQQKLPGKGRKKLLASQDMQYYRQSRGKCQRSITNSTVLPKPAERPVKEALSKPTSAPEGTEEPCWGGEENDDYFLPCSQPYPDQITDSKKPAKQVKIGMLDEFNKAIEQIDTSVQSSKSTEGSVRSTAEYAERTKDQSGFDDDDEWRYLTQNEATDMELCSQMEQLEKYGEDFYTQRDPVNMDIDTDDEPDTTWEPTVVPPQPLLTSVPGKEIPAARSPSSLNENVFLKPESPPVTHKKAKPSTTKIYASVSRSASLAMEMGKASKPLPAANVTKASKSFNLKITHSFPVQPCPAKIPPAPKPLPSQSISPKAPMSSLNQAANFLPSKPPNQAAKTGPHRPTQPLPNQAAKTVPHRYSFLCPSNPVPKSQPCSYNSCPRPEVPVSVPAATMAPTQSFDQSYLTQAILKWEYRMFDNYKTFGPPDDLHPLPLKKVPTTFSTYQDYFNGLFPLLLLNAFEEMAGEWHSGRRIELHLQVQGIEYSNRTASASFTANLNPQQDMKQLYPKEDDLVFLWLPDNTGTYTSDEIHDSLPYVGFVSRSMVYSNRGGQPSTLNLTIQTRGNVSSVNTQFVQCKVIGSLVSTQREFQALCNLRHNMMKKVLLVPHAAAFMTSPARLPDIVMPKKEKYNEDQRKAIGCGVAMVKRSQKPPKILLIHGPPGTGKSMTIVGLLYNLLFNGAASMSVNRGTSCQMRILVCAPSNAAIDNLMKKMIPIFKEKSTVPQGNCGDINLVRLGSEKSISKALSPFSLDSQTKAKTMKAVQNSDSDIQRQKEELDQRIDNISQQCAKTPKKSAQFEQLMNQKSNYLKVRDKLARQLREIRSKRQEVKTRLLQDANVICSTLSTSGSNVLESAFRRIGREPFSCVIIDEAGQAKETESLIPFLYRCPALILVGDPEQLPPTVVSQKAKELGYDQSLMARLMLSLHQQNPQLSPSIFLSMQYRMHPDICEFPSKHIYHKKLKTDCAMAQQRCSLRWPFEPYRVFDVMDGRESRERDSFCNVKEVRLVLFLVRLIMEKHPVRVGIITPYSSQKRRILDAISGLRQKSNCPAFSVDVNTVDGFQGREMDCIIVSCVRASSEMGSIGFVGNRQRMNVTITRAKFSLFILGHLRTLREQSDWGALVDDAARRGTIIKTQECDFPKDARKILKSDLQRLSRSVSYPPIDGLGHASPEYPAPNHREAIPARVSRTHRPSEPSSNRSPTVSSSTGGQRGSPPPTHHDLPRDPHLPLRPSDPRLEVHRQRWEPRQPVREVGGERRNLLDQTHTDGERRDVWQPRQPVRELSRERRDVRDPRQPVRELSREQGDVRDPRQPVREPRQDPRQPVR